MNADEVFFTGTAVIMAPVGSISFNNKKIDYKSSYSDSMTNQIRETLIDIQNEKIEDSFGWISSLELDKVEKIINQPSKENCARESVMQALYAQELNNDTPEVILDLYAKSS